MGIIIPTLEGKMRLNYLKSNTFQNVLSDLSLYSKLLSNPVLKMLLPYLLRWQWILNLSWHYLILLTSLLHSRYITQVESQTKHMGNWTYCPVILPPRPGNSCFSSNILRLTDLNIQLMRNLKNILDTSIPLSLSLDKVYYSIH